MQSDTPAHTPAPAAAAPEPAAPGPSTPPQRLHLFTPIFLLVKQARQLAFLLALIVVRRWWGAILPLLLLGAAWTVLAWWRHTWMLDGDALRIEEGVIGRKQRVVPLDRIQQVDIRRRLVHRLLGVASLRVETGGGGGGSEVELDALSVKQAAELRETLLAARARARAAAAPGERGSAEGPADAAELDAPVVEERLVAKLGIGQVIVAGITSARAAAALAVIGPITQYADDFFQVDFTNLVADWLVDQSDRVASIGALTIALGVLGTIVLWFILAAGAGVLIDYGFSMTIKGRDLVVRRGLLERREIVIPLARVQVVRVGESWVRRLLGMATVQVFSGGSAGRESFADRVAIPILPLTEVDRVLRDLLPDAAPLPRLARPPLAARRRAIVGEVLGWAPFGALVGAQAWWLERSVAALWTALAGALAGAAIGVLFGLARWRNRGHAWERDLLFARNGVAVRWTAIVPAVRAQSVRASSSVLQRRAGLATLYVDVAGASPNPHVVDERAERVEDLLGSLVREGKVGVGRGQA
jgi:putative membrane protein